MTASRRVPIGKLEFAHPYVTVDIVLLTVAEGELQAIVIEREEDPAGWALPGAFVQVKEGVDETAQRVLVDKIGFATLPPTLALKPFDALDRDPRRRVITLPYVALVDLARLGSTKTDQPQYELATVTLDDDLELTVRGQRCRLVFDHENILEEAVSELRRRFRLADPELQHQHLLPTEFTLRDLQEVHEAVLGEPVNRDSFRRRMTSLSGPLEATGKFEEAVGHRPAEYYRWRGSR